MDEDLSGIGLKQSADHVDRGGLPGPVRSKETKDLVPVNLKIKVVNGNQFTITLG
jgi:hypothetical protein